MPQYVMLQQPNKLQWLEQFGQTTGNFLGQLMMMKIAHNIRMDEQDREIEQKKAMMSEQRQHEKELSEQPLQPYSAKMEDGTTANFVFDPVKRNLVQVKGTEEKPERNYKTYIRATTLGQPPDQQDIIHLPGNQAPPKEYVPYSSMANTPTNIFLGQDVNTGAPIFGSSKGPPNPRAVQTPQGTEIGPKAGRLPAEQQKQLVDLQNVGQSADTVLKTLEQSKSVENWLGYFSGKARNISSAVTADPEWIGFKNQVGQLRAVVYGLSGKQINESELKWLKEELLPQLESPGPNFKATLKNLKDWVSRNKGNLEQAYKEQGYIVGGTQGGGKRPPLDEFFKK